MQIQSYEEWELKEKLPPRYEDSNKGDYGKLLLAAGSRNMCGAAYLAGKAAYRSGVGLVYIYTEECNRVILQELLPEAVLITYQPERWDRSQLETALQGITAVAAGPGVGKSTCAGEILQTILKNRLPKVLDADALNLLASHPQWYKLAQDSFVVTPHPMEMSRLTGIPVKEIQEHRSKIALDYAREHHLVTVLKGSHTVVTDGLDEYINNTGNHGMATGGSGDVLTGVIGAFLAQKMDLFEAARLGVYVHGLAGDTVRKERGTYSMMAGDIADRILYGIE